MKNLKLGLLDYNIQIVKNTRKLYNTILYIIKNKLSMDNNINTNKFILNYEELREVYFNTDHIKGDLNNLNNILVSSIENNFNLSCPLIYNSKAENGIIELVIPTEIINYISTNVFFNINELKKINSFESKYSISLYELIARNKRIKKIIFSTNEFKKFIGLNTNNSYKNFDTLRSKVLSPAIQEINTKTDILLSYKTIKKRGNKITDIEFLIQNKKSSNSIKKITKDSEPLKNKIIPPESVILTIKDIKYKLVPIE